ncbi:MAG TPA: hypothetical protein ENH53_02710 [Bacteroidetes bacterium]|nr:hypothetical protein [Bacteroidota bacterium]
MAKFPKVFFVVFIVILGFMIWYGYPILKDRYFNGGSVKIKNSSIENKTNGNAGQESEQSGELTNESEEIIEDQEEQIQEEQETLKSEGKIYLKITPEDCDSECEKFSGDNLEYCQEVCGLKPPEENQENCDSLSGLEKDYCLKNLGIQNKDFSYCDKISDSNIAETCNNRITEELLENDGSLQYLND